MTRLTCYAIEIYGRYYNRILEEFTDLSHATLYERTNPEDLKLFLRDKNQLLDLGFHIQASSVTLAG